MFDVLLTISKFQHVWPSLPKNCRLKLWYILDLNQPRSVSKSFSVMPVLTYSQGSDSLLYAIRAEMWVIYYLPNSQKDLQPNRNKTGLGYWDQKEKSKTSNVIHWYFHEQNIPCSFHKPITLGRVIISAWFLGECLAGNVKILNLYTKIPCK